MLADYGGKICGKKWVLSQEWNSKCAMEGESGEQDGFAFDTVLDVSSDWQKHVSIRWDTDAAAAFNNLLLLGAAYKIFLPIYLLTYLNMVKNHLQVQSLGALGQCRRWPKYCAFLENYTCPEVSK